MAKGTPATLTGKRFRHDLLLFAAPSRHLRPNHDDNTRFTSIQPWREQGNFRSSTGTCVPVRNRNVGTLLLLRHAGTARSLHGQVSVCLAARRGGDWPCVLSECAGTRVRSARSPTSRLASLRFLHRPGLFDANPRWIAG